MVNSPVFYAAIMTLWLVKLPGFLNISHVPGIVMSLIITAIPNLLILHSVEAVSIAQWTQWSPVAKYQITVPVCIIERTESRASGIRGCFLHLMKYGFQIKGIVLYYWSSLRCIKCCIVIYYRGLKFPHRAAVLLVLESDGACTGLNGHCARKSTVLVLVCCYKARGDREQDLWRYWLPEGCIKQWYDRASGYGCHSNKCLKGEQWSSDLAVSRI